MCIRDRFIYAVRAAGIRVGETQRDDRYFRPDRNPVVLTGLREESVTVGAGTFVTTVVRPIIKSGGIFAENGEAQVWFTNDARRLPVQVKTKFSRFSLTLSLQSVTALPDVRPRCMPCLSIVNSRMPLSWIEPRILSTVMPRFISPNISTYRKRMM